MIKCLITPKYIGILLVIMTWLAFFAPILSGKYVYFLDDLKIIYYPIEAVYAQFQHSWQLPLWANEFGFGQPLMAWGQLGFFTPVHLLLRALYVHPLTLLQVSVCIYFLIGSVSMYAFLRKRKIDTVSASLGAVIFAYCGFSIGHLNHVNFYTSTMILPILLLALDALIKKPTLRKACYVALAGSVIAVSGQPQVILYVYIVATIIGLAMFIPELRQGLKKSSKTIALTILAGGIAFCLSSLSLLPLLEFLPNTERSAGLPYTELFEFSYPSYNTITIIFPYFFGGHDNYFGPKGFQELAMYVGIIPILLVGMALWSWKTHKAERIAGIVLIILGSVLALGRYSAIYTYLVDHHYIQTIGVVGRFVFFVDIGIVLLAGLGLHDIITNKRTIIKKIIVLLSGLGFAWVVIALPFISYANQNKEAWQRLLDVASFSHTSIWIITLGILSIPLALFIPRARIIVTALTAITLVIYGWDYNPRTLAQEAYTPSPFIQNLIAHKSTTGVPARLYATEHLDVTGNKLVKVTLTDPISPKFSVVQPLNILKANLSCITIPIQADSEKETFMTMVLRSGLDGHVWYQRTISSKDAFNETKQHICFSQIPESEQHNLTLSFSSSTPTNMRLFVTPSKNEQSNIYFIRTNNPSTDQLQASRKAVSLQYAPEYPIQNDLENTLLKRHIQAVGGASSATWIGALSIRPYREFVDTFFANDADSAFDGDGIHALARNKELLSMAGVTHFIQSIPYDQTYDPMVDAGYTHTNTADTGNSFTRMYTNPHAYPKAFMVQHAQFISADDEIRTQLLQKNFNPKAIVYLSGPTPPTISPANPSTQLKATADIIHYTQTRVDVQVTTNTTAYLVVTDATLPEWQTYIDDKPAIQLKANSVFKSAQVPEGTHVVSFRYSSPAVHKAKILTSIGFILFITCYAIPPRKKNISA